MRRTALVTDRRYLAHFAGRAHPERPERIKVMLDMSENLRRPGLRTLAPREAARDEIALCHDRAYLALVERTASMERFDFDPDTHSSRETFKTALLAAGGVLTAVEAVADGEAHNAFAIVRPPGHHALPGRAMGFCFFNNIAIAAEFLLKIRGLQRVMIIDWDLHHGNGTQDVFYDRDDVLYLSLHQYPWYPGTGSLQEIGAAAGEGFTVNLPLAAEFGDDEYLRAFDDVVIPIGRRFRPEFILVSAGFDCHFRDPLGAMQVTEEGFQQMARRIGRLAAECCGGRLVAALEGGYDLEALANSAREVLLELGREPDEPLSDPRGGERAMPIIERAMRGAIGRRWQLA